PRDVTRWLTTLACHLKDTSARYGWPATDITLPELWPIAGPDAPRYWTATLVLLTLTGLPALPLTAYKLTTKSLSDLDYWLSVALILLFLVVALPPVLSRERISPKRLDLRQLRQSAVRRKLAVGLGFGLAVGLAVGLASGLVSGLPSGLGS